MNDNRTAEQEAIIFFPDTHTEKYIYDGPHQKVNPKWSREMENIEANRFCFIDGYNKAIKESQSTINQLREENERLKRQLESKYEELVNKVTTIQELQAENERLKKEALEREEYIGELREAVYYPDKSLKPVVKELVEALKLIRSGISEKGPRVIADSALSKAEAYTINCKIK